MRHALTEQRREALLENADKLHSGSSMSAPTLKRGRLGAMYLSLAMLSFAGFIIWAFNA